jgi:hypothetical protein
LTLTAWRDRREHPTLLVRTDPRIGLIDTDVDALIAFAAGLDTVEDDALPPG